MAVFRGFYRVIRTALFALSVFFFAFSEAFSATSPSQFVLYSDLTMSKVEGTFVENWANMKLEDVINGFIKNASYQSNQDIIRCAIMDDEFQYVDKNVDFQNNWNIFNTFSVGISDAKNEFVCYDFVNREVDCAKTTLESIVAQYNSDCNYLYNSNNCYNAWRHSFSNATQKCIQDGNGSAPCSEADHIISCWIETRPKGGLFMYIPIVTGSNGDIVLKSDNKQIVTEVLMDGPYFDTWRLTGAPSNQHLVFDGFLLSATDTKGNYYPLRYIATNGTVYNLFDNWYTSLTDGGDSTKCNALVGKTYNHATYDMTLKGTNACGNGYEIFDSKTTLALLNNLYTNLPNAGFDVTKMVGYDPTNGKSWVPVAEQSGTVRLVQICSGIDKSSSGNVVSKDLPICNIAGVDLSKAALDDYLGYTNKGLALVAVWASDDTHTYLTSLPASSSSGVSCSNGYHSEDVQTLIGSYANKYISYGWTDGKDNYMTTSGGTEPESFYGITKGDTNSFGIHWTEEDIIHGHAACSTTSGTTQPYVADQTGQPGAQYCWCTVDGYNVLPGATSQSLSSSWEYEANLSTVYDCSDNCSFHCAKKIADDAAFDARVIPSENVCVIYKYTISYNLNGGTNDTYNKSWYTVEHPTRTLRDPTKSGYTFGGWYENSNFTGSAVTQIPSGSTGNKTLYAKWTPTSYTISYNLDGGTNDANNPASYTIESQTITFADPTKTGYTFGGWYTDSTFETPITQIQTGSTGNRTLYAKWTQEIICPENAHKESGVCVCDTGYNNGLQSEISTSVGTSYASINNSGSFNESGASHGQSYYGINDNNTWAVDYGNNGMLIGQARCSTTAGADNTLTYTYIEIDSNFVDNLAGGDETGQTGANYCYCNATEYIPFGGNAQSLISPWGFRRDYSDASSCASGCASTCMDSMSGSNLSYNADFRKALLKRVVNPQACVPSTYTITYNLNGGTNNINNPTSYTSNSATITLANPTKSGYIFGGWYTDSTFETPITQIQTGSTGNKTLYAKWFTSAFSLTTTSTTSSFQFIISATGEFAVDCGDGGSLSGTGFLETSLHAAIQHRQRIRVNGVLLGRI